MSSKLLAGSQYVTHRLTQCNDESDLLDTRDQLIADTARQLAGDALDQLHVADLFEEATPIGVTPEVLTNQELRRVVFGHLRTVFGMLKLPNENHTVALLKNDRSHSIWGNDSPLLFNRLPSMYLAGP